MSRRRAEAVPHGRPFRVMKRGPLHGWAAVIVGLAHFLAPRVFYPFNRLAFPVGVRTFTYIHGGVETLLGVLTVADGTRRPAKVLGIGYLGYLATCITVTQIRRRRAASSSGSP